jgi:hypothetical protein
MTIAADLRQRWPSTGVAVTQVTQVAERLVVPFAGEGSGTGELTWGQQTIWRGIMGKGAPVWLNGCQAVPEGTTLQDVADLLSFIVSRHQSLRTRLVVEDGIALQQVVSSSGELHLDVMDAPDDADPYVFAKARDAEWEEGPLDYASEWPVRMAVIRHRGVPTHWIMAMCHMVSDAFGVGVLLADMKARDPDKPIVGKHPLEEARWQSSPAGKRCSTAAEKYWERALREIHPRRFPDAPPPGKPDPSGRVTFDSRAAYQALQIIGARVKADTSPVLLAATAVSLSRVTGLTPATPRVYVNNRFRPGLSSIVSPIAQTCPCAIDVAGITFDEAVRRAYYASMRAFKYAYFVPVRIREILAAVSAERGEKIDVSLIYNDRRIERSRDINDTIPTLADVRASLPQTTLTWDTREREDLCNINIIDSPDTVRILLLADGSYVYRAQVEALLRGIETILVEAALDPEARTGV